MVEIESRPEGEYIALYIDGVKIPREKVAEWAEKIIKIDGADPQILEAMKKFFVMFHILPTEERLKLYSLVGDTKSL